MQKKNKHAFTLVELIVVISVLGVLSALATSSIGNVTLNARNSTRMTNLSSLQTSLALYQAEHGQYPLPDNKADIVYSGSVIGYQGYIKSNVARLLRISEKSSQDPLDESRYFSYATDISRSYMQLLGFLEENRQAEAIFTERALADSQIDNKIPYAKGEELGIIFLSGTLTPIQDISTTFDLKAKIGGYVSYFNQTESVSATGTVLQNLPMAYLYGNRYASPESQYCPTGFIPVPGNSDFNQPGFCVMKYEAKVAGGAQNADYGGHLYVAWEQISSIPSDTPVVNITQQQAIDSCSLLGTGYHLITNNEWMTIARNIEKTTSNWSSGIVGSGYIFSWHNDGWPFAPLVASSNDNDGYTGTLNSSSSGPNQKRTLILPNGSVIWDFAGNVREHVNKANTLDGTDHYNPDIWTANACGGNGTYSFFYNATSDTQPQCGFVNGYTYANFGPLVTQLNKSNGIGQIFSYNYSGGHWNIFLRGGYWNSWDSGGIYGAALDWGKNDNDRSEGFRCAK